ncbi:trigger factor [Methylobacillus sp. MM3]|uniref:trigger factor n=1 Tax=Methylobacillus sp. MM3 TaxID=1848039 RepID=UPI0007E03B96|nr:trigger factor [Methylobacillus sp. MM3]OAJ71681.1 trigger factor [Methylobacillus sp. MM3]
MQATVETLSNLERRMTVSVPMKPIEEEVGQRLGRLARTVKMAGFRPGKVPMSLVQKNYGPQVFDEVISSTVERSFTEAVTENKLRVAGYPNIEQKPSAETEGNFEFIATFEVFPEVVVGELSAVSIERPTIAVGDADIDRTIEVLQKQRATYEPVKRASKKGDKISVTFRAEIDGQEVESTNGNAIDLILGEDGRIAEFDDNLIGAKAGATKKFDITYAEDNPSPQLAGKTVSYDVTVNTVAQTKLPELDAEFAKSLGIESGDIEKMRADIQDSLQQEVTKRVRAKLKEQVFKALVDAVNLDLPRALIAMETNRLMQGARANLQQRGMDPAQVNLEPAMFEEQAKRSVHLRLILAELVNKNELHATPEQIRAMVDEFAKSFEQPEEVVRWYYSDPQRLDEPMGLATEENVVNWVLERSKVTDKAVSFDELMGNA